MDGIDSVTRGRFAGLVGGYAVIAAAIVIIGTVNVLSVLHDADRIGRSLDWWEPVVWEATSGIAALAFVWLAWVAVRASLASAKGSVALIPMHLGAALAFSGGHVILMVVLRYAAYALLGSRYSFGDPAAEFLYELRKDLVSYLLFAATFWVALRLGAESRSRPASSPILPETQPPLFEIRDGSRIVRVPVDEIIAVRSAGNYAEFLLTGGRRELMRITLASAAEQLAKYGIARTHRSWLLNPLHIREVNSQGSGDYQFTVTDGILVPQSRRYRRADGAGPEGRGALPA